MGKKYFLLLIFLASSIVSFSQTYTMNNGANGTISTCSGTFIDDGGGGNYGNNQNSTITFCPSTPGDKIKIVFNTFATEGAAGTCTDYLDVWYANAVGAVGTNNDRLCGALGAATLVSTSPDGCISFQFISNNNVRDTGWSATVSCVTPCTNPIAALTDTSTLNICSSSAINPGSLAVSFNGSASTAPGGFSITSYEWTWGDGTNSTTATSSTSHTFPGPGIYSVSLSVRNNNTDIDPLGCQSTNASTRLIRVLPPPDFTGSTLSTFNINCGDSVNFSGLATSQTMSTGPLSVSGTPISLPDGSGVSYTTTLDFTGVFPVGATVAAGCYPTVTFDLEHTYSGDLDIVLISPTGQSVLLFDQHGSGNNFGLCANPADDGVAGCPATYTVVNSGGVAWTAAGVTTTAPANGTCSYTGACETGSNYISQTYNSTNPFTAFNGADLNGVWTLQITDNLGLDDGTITGWSLSFPGSCYANAEFVTPDVSTLTWSNSGAGPVLPAQTTTSTSVTDPGPDGCPLPGTCVGNQLTNNVAVGPFPSPGAFTYTLTATDEYGCNYVRNVTVNVASCVCNLNLTSVAGSNNQTVCINNAINSITYSYGGSATGATVTGLPTGVNATISGGLITISGTPTVSGPFNYTVTTVGCTPNLSLTGTINVSANPVLTSLTSNTPICANSNAEFYLAGTPNSTVTYNIGGGASQTVVLNGTGNATVTVPTVVSNTTLNTLLIQASGAPIVGNGLSATGGNTPVNSTGVISALGATSDATNCASVDNTNSTLTITLQHTVPAGTVITISIARSNNQGDVTITGGGATTTFSAGPNNVLQRITLTTTAATSTITVTRTNGIVWVDGVQYTYIAPGCSSVISNSTTVVVNSVVVPTITTTAATCSAAGSSTISNYSATNTYTFAPAGPTVGAGGLISGMTVGTSYTVTSTNGGCTSLASASFSNAAQLVTPAVPTITTTAATCSAAGSSTISNYSASNTYTFAPAGPTVGAGGLISGMTVGTSYTVTATNSGCISLASASFSNAAQLVTPAVPTIATTAATCSAAGSSTISNYSATNTYTFAPAGPTVGAGGLISGMTVGTSYTVTSTNGGCTSLASASFSNAAQLVTPAVPTITTTAATCSAAGSSTISNYSATNTYTFAPAGPTVGAGGLISGMTVGTSYTVTATNSGCTSLVSASFSNAAQLVTPAVPTIATTAATCSAAGSSTISNYSATNTYTFAPAGPTVGAGGLISGMTVGTSYTVTSTNGGCTSLASASFSNAAQLVTPAVPTITTTAATCSAAGSSTISNYSATNTYTFAPAGPTVGAGGLISGMTVGTSYTVTSTNGGCTSLASASFSNAAQLVTPAVPTITTTAATCSAAGSSTISNYSATNTYTFAPVGPTVGAGGLISGMTVGTSYTVTSTNGGCTSLASASFSNAAQLVTPAVPTITTTAATCSAAGSSTISNYSATNTYTFAPVGPTVGAGGLISGMTVGTSYTVTATNGGCTSLVSASFSNAAQLVTPAVPTIATTAATCSAAGSSTISNYSATNTYTFAPAGPIVGAGGLISGMTVGTSYTVTSTNGGCTSLASASFSNAAQLVTPAVPTITTTAATCSAAGSSTISNYSATNTYTFAPVGPTVGAGGLISGMTVGTSYTVTATNSGCTSLASASFSNAAQLVTPAVPTITTTAATCSAAGSSTISNYSATNTYTFAPVGPTVGAGGLISGMTVGTSYTVTSTNGGCTSLASASFSNAAQLVTPAVPTITTTAATCSATGSSTISNYSATNTYTFAPAGPTVGAGGLISGMTVGTSYTVTATNSGCTSLVSASFSNAAQLVTPAVPTIATTAATCSAAGSSTISNYSATNTYTFAPVGPTVGAGGLISGMTVGTSYTVTSTNGGCTSLASASFSNAAQLVTPAVPTITTTAATCSATGSSTISNYSATNTYTFAPAGPTVGAGGLISGMTVGTSYTVTATNSGCTSLVSASFSNAAQLVTPAVPTIATTAATCSAAGSSTISNYSATNTYTFAPVGPTVGAGGLISGMTVGTSYTVTSTNGGCTSLASASFSNAAQLVTPAVPTITTTAATCSATGSSTISNYSATNTYTFAPAGPTVGAGGLISGMTVGTSYTVTATNSGCTSLASASFSNAAQLVTPAVPTITTTAATCSAAGSSTISNYSASNTYTFAPAGPTVGAGGLISGMTVGTSYTVTSTNGGCTSLASASFSNAAQLVTPAVPTITTTAATCSAAGSSTISNYSATNTYTFAPVGPTVGAGGLISGMTVGTSYTVTATNSGCTSLVSASFSNVAQLVTPAVPTITTTAATCSAAGSSTISNYSASNTYTFAPVGPTVGAGGLISGMTVSTSYTVTSTNGGCTSLASASFSNAAQLVTPAVPTITTTAATCSAAGSSTISNYSATNTYTFAPVGPTVGAGGLISGMTVGTSYTVTATNSGCTSLVSASFSNAAQLVTPAVPTITTTAATCSAAGSSTISNYSASNTYTFAPVGPTVGAGGLISGMTVSTSYTVTSTNGGCTSLASASFSNAAQLVTPAVPTITTTAATCSAAGSSTISNYSATNTYTFAPAGPTVGAGGLISGMTVGTSYTVTSTNGGCTSLASASFSNAAQLVTPAVPTITTTAATCSAAGSSTISNYSASNTYTFAPVGPTVGAGGLISGMTVSTSYTVTSTNGGCTSLASASFSNAAQLVTPAVPTITTTAATCSAAGSSTISNYSATNTYTFAPAGPTVGAGGLISGMTVGTSYTVTSTNGGCTSLASASFSNAAQLPKPILTYTVTNPICDGSTLDFDLNSNVSGTTYDWSISSSYINSTGFNFSGTGEAALNQAVHLLDPAADNGSITVAILPIANGCLGDLVTVNLQIKPIPVASIVSFDNTICSGETVHLEFTALPANGTTYTWTTVYNNVIIAGGVYNGTSSTGILDVQLTTAIPSLQGTIEFFITPFRNGCQGDTIQTGLIYVNPIPSAPILVPVTPICSGAPAGIAITNFDNTILEWDVVASENVTGFVQSGSGQSPLTISDILVNASNNQGFVTYRVTSVSGDCRGQFTDFTVIVNPLPKPILTDGHICVNATTGLTYQGYVLDTQLSGSNLTYQWLMFDETINDYSPIAGANDSTYEAMEEGDYQVIVTNTTTGCIGSSSAEVNEVFPATAFTATVSDAFTNDSTITVTVNPIGTGNLIYALDEGAWQDSNVFTGVEAGEHTVLVSDLEGCTNLTIDVTVIDYPKYFTPNGDGIHDTWNIVGLNQADAKLYIFDRYGKLIKQISTIEGSKGWDGTYNGAQLPSTDYWFTIDFTENDQQKQFKSHFSLKR